MLGRMTTAWLLLLAEYGWETPTEELTWCTTQDDGGVAQIFIDDKRTKRTTAPEGFKVLGTFVTFENMFDTELEHRLTRANRALYASWELLGCTSIPLEKRLQVFRSVVDTAVCWCADSWNLERTK